MSVKVAGMVMSCDRFIAVKDNPRQRDTIAHAKTAMKKHLRQESPLHLRVAVATTGSEMWKLDGHTRAYLWETGKLQKPQHVNVDVYYVADRKEAEMLYKGFDNRDSVETTRDVIFGDLRSLGIKFTSSLLTQNQFKSVMKLIQPCKTLSEYDSISLLKNELLEMDSWGLSKKNMPAGIVAYFLLDLIVKRNDQEKLKEFAIKYNEDAGIKTGKYFDGVYALTEHIKRRKMVGSMYGWLNYEGMMSCAYVCVDNYIAGRSVMKICPSKYGVNEMQKQANEIFGLRLIAGKIA